MSHFKLEEFTCNHCGVGGVTDEMSDMLNKAREILGEPIVLTSAYRCPYWNEHEGGSPTSSHLTGHAVDIKCSDAAYRFKLIASLMEAGFNRIGIAGSFIHVDIDPNKNENRVWTY